jgi:hypothetical protein
VLPEVRKQGKGQSLGTFDSHAVRSADSVVASSFFADAAAPPQRYSSIPHQDRFQGQN